MGKSYYEQEKEMLFEILGGVNDNTTSQPSPFIPTIPIPGNDPTLSINSNKIGILTPDNSPVFKKTQINLREKNKQQVLELVEKGDLIEIGDSNINPTNFAKGNENLQSVLILDNKYYLEKKSGEQFLKWANEMRSKNIPFLISSAVRFGKNTGGGAHGYGIAVDFSNLYSIVNGSTNLIINKNARILSPIYTQIASIGAKYGWYNPWRLSNSSGTIDEIWHFEYWGPA